MLAFAVYRWPRSWTNISHLGKGFLSNPGNTGDHCPILPRNWPRWGNAEREGQREGDKSTAAAAAEISASSYFGYALPQNNIARYGTRQNIADIKESKNVWTKGCKGVLMPTWTGPQGRAQDWQKGSERWSQQPPRHYVQGAPGDLHFCFKTWIVSIVQKGQTRIFVGQFIYVSSCIFMI